MKRNLLFVSLFISLIITACEGPSNNSVSDSLKTDTNRSLDTSRSSTLKSDTGKVITNALTDSNWNYSGDTDKMTDKIVYHANVSSTNQLNLSAPYDGVNFGRIHLRYKRGVTDAIFTIDKGQFMSGVYGMDIKVRFDKNKTETYNCSKSDDDDPTVLFINSSSRFISKLKKSKKLIIEATVYQDGDQQMEFNVDGLKWDH